MERQHKQPAANTAASSPASSGSSSSSHSIQGSGSMSSTFLGVSSSTHFHPERPSSPSLCAPPAPAPLPSLIAPGGSALGLSSSGFHQIPPSPRTAAKRRPRPRSQLTHSLPTPFLSELSKIRRISNNIFGDLNVQEMTRTRHPLPLLHGQQEQEMTQSSSSLTMPHSYDRTPIPPTEDFSTFPSASQQQQALTMGGLSGFAPPPLQQQQAPPTSFSSLQPLPSGNFSEFPLPASSQPQQMQPSSSTDLPTRIFSGLEELPAASQHYFSTYASSSCDQSMGSSIAGSCQQGWADMPALANKLDMMSIGGSSCSAGPQMPQQLPALGAGASRSKLRRGCTMEHYFSDAEMETINKDNRLKDLVKTDFKKTRRILRNRQYVARLKLQKANHIQDLERQTDALRMECSSLSAEVQSHKEVVDNLKSEIRQSEIKINGLKEQANLSQALNDQLQSEIERLKLL